MLTNWRFTPYAPFHYSARDSLVFYDTIAAMLSILLTILLATEPIPTTVAFVGYTDSVSQIYLLDAGLDTTTAIGPPNARGPLRWSPDGQWLACTVLSEGQSAICLIPVNGETPVYIEHAQSFNQFPRWHHSGTKLAYQSGTFPNTTIRVYDVDTKTESTWGGDAQGLMRPVWLYQPDFIQAQLPVQERETLKLDGTGGLVAVQLEVGEQGWTTQLAVVSQGRTLPFPKRAYDSPNEEHTEWAIEPGRKDRSFVYESNDGGDREIFLMTKRRTYDMSNHRAADVNPVWSPDGRWVAFESYRNGHRGIYRAHRDSGRVLAVLEGDDIDYWSPAWSSDGTTIICVAKQHGSYSLVVREIESKKSFSLSASFEVLEHPAWKP